MLTFNNYGSHDGGSLLESYISDIANRWRMNIVIGTGNEGAAGKHANGILRNPPLATPEIIELAVGEFENTFNLQI